VAVIFVMTVFGGIGLLVLAVWPGLLEAAVFDIPLVFVSVPLLGCWFILLVASALRDLARMPGSARRRRKWGLASATVMFAMMGLLWFQVPQRVGLSFCTPRLQELVDAAPRGGGVQELGERVGPYRVDVYGGDPRGGVYFRTRTEQAGLSPDQMSYGFAFRPNGRGTPFGNAYYQLRHLFGDWYGFTVSDDW
jgi:hypothetical protein